MKTWAWLLILLVIACAAAFGWQALASDPGEVLVRIGSTQIQTTLIFAIVALILAVVLLTMIWRLLRWPRNAWARRVQRRGRERIASGLTALAEGHYQLAQRELERASQQTGLRAPALLAAAWAAQARGETTRAQTALDEAGQSVPAAALALRARLLLESGSAKAALKLLDNANLALTPNALRIQAEAALACNDPDTAMSALKALQRSSAFGESTLAPLQTRVLVAAIEAARNGDDLTSLWSSLNRHQRSVAVIRATYARCAAQFGQVLAAMDELESGLHREWFESLVLAYGELGEAHADTRLRRAEGWLDTHPDSPALLLTLGRLCLYAKLWGKAVEYLKRGLALEPSAVLWETLGEYHSSQNHANEALDCYRNALRCSRGETVRLPSEVVGKPVDTRASIIERRSAHGVPQLDAPPDHR